MERGGLCRTFFAGGFECSCHRAHPGRRLDVLESSGHARLALEDYRRLRRQGIRTVRDGLRWHLVERAPRRLDFASVLPMVHAAREARVQVIWDLCHFGWPDHLDVFSTAFVGSFARLARAFARLLLAESDQTPVIAPINEISFVAWAGGEVGAVAPFARGRGDELKRQLVRAAIEGIEGIWSVAPEARIVHTDPAIHIVAGGKEPARRHAARCAREAQFAALDMLTGRLAPELGGAPRYLGVVGLNYYPYNQWVHEGPRLVPGDPEYLPLRWLLLENHNRYGKPILLAETGAEAPYRAGWLRWVGREVRAAMELGVPVHGICWYPIVDHPGWDDDRHCRNGLWGYPDRSGGRPICRSLARELRRQRRLFRTPLSMSHSDGLLRPAP